MMRSFLAIVASSAAIRARIRTGGLRFAPQRPPVLQRDRQMLESPE